MTNQARWKAFVKAYGDERDELIQFAKQQVEAAQLEAARLAVEHSELLVSAQIGDAGIGRLASLGMFNRVPVEALTELVSVLQSGSPLADLPGLSKADVRGMSRELVRGIVNGTHSRTIARNIARETGIGRARALTISRTETFRAHREASRLAFQQNQAVNAWRWVAALGPRTCSACYAMHGTIHSRDEPMGTHPNCRCTMVPVVDTSIYSELGVDEPPGIAWQSGEDAFADASDDVQASVLGRDRYALYKAGRLTLEDTVQVTNTKKWGTSRTVKPLKDSERKAARTLIAERAPRQAPTPGT